MKKGLLFSFIMVSLAITLLSLIAVQKSLVFHKREQISIEARINDMDKMYESIIRDVNKASEIIIKRAISVCIGYIVAEGEALDNSQASLKELTWNGTLNETEESLMKNNTLPDWIEKIRYVGDLKGYDINISIDNFEIRPYDSWNLVTEGIMQINISDQGGIASFNKVEKLNYLVSIEGFEDPLYPLNTIGRATNVIVKGHEEYTELIVNGNGNNVWVYGESVVILASDIADILAVQNKNEKILVTDDASLIPILTVNEFLGVVSETNVGVGTTITYIANATNAMNLIENETNILVDGDNDKVWYIDNLKEHTENSFYYASSNGASFLDRLEGELEVQAKYASQSTHTIGLESFVNKVYFFSIDLPIKTEQTNIDYLYFSDNTVSGSRVKGLDPSLRIDNRASLGSTHQEIYGVSELLI